MQLNNKQATQSKNEQKTWIDKKTSDGQQEHKKMFNIANYQEYKSKPQCEITSHWLEWLSSNGPQVTNFGKDMEKRKPLNTAAGIENWCSHCEKIVWGFLKKTKIELPHDPTIALLGIHQEKEKTLIWKDTCNPVFIAALFKLPKYENNLTVPSISIDEWIRVCGYVHEMLLKH